MINNTIKYLFYIGSNNTTKQPEHQKAIKLLNQESVKGFTIKKGLIGFWEGKQEKSFVIEIISNKFFPFNDDNALKLKRILEEGLKQELILTEKIPTILID